VEPESGCSQGAAALVRLCRLEEHRRAAVSAFDALVSFS